MQGDPGLGLQPFQVSMSKERDSHIYSDNNQGERGMSCQPGCSSLVVSGSAVKAKDGGNGESIKRGSIKPSVFAPSLERSWMTANPIDGS